MNNFLSKVLLLLLLTQIGFLVYQFNKVKVKNLYIQSRSIELKQENDKWLNFITNSLFFLTEKDSKRREDLLFALSELDFKKENTPPNTIELYHNHMYINPQILSLLSSQYIKQNNSGWNLLSYKVFKDIYSQQYFVGNNTYHFRSFESHNYEKYDLNINGKKLTWNNDHSYTFPKSDSLDIKLNRIFLDFETGNLSSNTSERYIRI